MACKGPAPLKREDTIPTREESRDVDRSGLVSEATDTMLNMVADVRNGIPTVGWGAPGDGVADRRGGYHLGRQADEQEAVRIVRTAVDNGINFLTTVGTTTVGRARSAWKGAAPTGIATRRFS